MGNHKYLNIINLGKYDCFSPHLTVYSNKRDKSTKTLNYH